MSARRPFARFVAVNLAVWLLMTAILVVLPDVLERWMSLSIGRPVAWAVAGGLWVILLEREWQARFGVVVRFAIQVVLWVASALLAMWLSDQFRV